MNQNRSENTNRNNNNDDNGSFWGTLAAVSVGAAALAGGLYLLTSGKKPEEEKEQAQSSRQDNNRRNPSEPVVQRAEPDNSISSYVTDLFERLQSPSQTSSMPGFARVQRHRNCQPKPTNMNALLSDIYVEYIALRDEDFELYYNVFTEIFFNKIHRKMKEVDKYYNKYYSTVQFAGSHYDSLRIDKPDEFDMDVLIDLPLNLESNPTNKDESDIVIEPKAPGFVQLKMGKQFQRLPYRDDWETNKTAYDWKDDRSYLLSFNFMKWFKGLVDRTLNTFEKTDGSKYLCHVDGVPYTISKSESGPAITLIIENKSRGFKMDFDLVPGLKFPESRWPVSAAYRKIPPGCNASQRTWMVVPKPNKTATCSYETSRSWRIAMHEQERGLMFNMGNMKQAIRLIKKLRDAQGMDKIASYYVKTLFFWEAIANDPAYWNKSPATLFVEMVKQLHKALVEGRIPYFWNKDNNLIGQIKRDILVGYAAKLSKLLAVLENPAEFRRVAEFLLTPAEFNEYNQRRLQ